MMSSLRSNCSLKVLASKNDLSKENSKIYLFANNMAFRPHDFNAKTTRLLRSARSVCSRTASFLCVDTVFKLKHFFNLTIIKFTLYKKPQLVRRHDNMLRFVSVIQLYDVHIQLVHTYHIQESHCHGHSTPDIS